MPLGAAKQQWRAQGRAANCGHQYAQLAVHPQQKHLSDVLVVAVVPIVTAVYCIVAAPGCSEHASSASLQATLAAAPPQRCDQTGAGTRFRGMPCSRPLRAYQAMESDTT